MLLGDDMLDLECQEGQGLRKVAVLAPLAGTRLDSLAQGGADIGRRLRLDGASPRGTGLRQPDQMFEQQQPVEFALVVAGQLAGLAAGQ